MASDLFLNDNDTVGIVGNELHLVRADGKPIVPVAVKGPVELKGRVLVSKPPDFKAILDVMLPKGKPTPGAPDKPIAEVGEPFSELAPPLVGGEVSLKNPVWDRLRDAKPPYDLYEMLDLLRQAVLDLNSRLGG